MSDYNTIKILYKDFIKYYHHPFDKTYKDIVIYSKDVFKAYLEIMNENYTLYNNEYFDTQKCRYIILTENDKNKFNKLFTECRKLKKKFIIVLMLSAEFIDISPVEKMKTINFSHIFNNMTEDKLKSAGLNVNWLKKHDFFN